MSAARRLFAAGKPLLLGERIGRGGEGEVHALADRPDVAVKLYTGAKPDERRDKVAAMVRAGLAASSPLVAFPQDAVTDGDGRFVGFTMRRIVGCQPLFELYAPGARKLAFPRATYRFLVAAAANIARAVAAVHEAGCVIGDINESGILVSKTALAALIDADSFQFSQGKRRFACRVGVAGYTPPELQKRRLTGVVRTVEHDRFGLAVVLFQLLFMGRHPYAGAHARGEMPIERAIAEHRFAYSTARAVGLKPPPGVPTLADLPPALAAAFEAAFAASPDPGRPGAKEWAGLLAAHEAELVTCAANAQHHHAAAAACPWCRMEAQQGISLFGGGERATARARRGWTAELADAWRRIEAASAPRPDRPQLPVPIVPTAIGARARAARRARLLRLGTGLGALLAAAVVVLLDAAQWPVPATVATLGCLMLLIEDGPTRALRRDKAAIDRRFAALMAEWHRHCDGEPVRQLRAELERARGDHRALPRIEAQAIAAYRRERRDAQLRAFLARHPISPGAVPGIDRAAAAMLAARGIRTAADVGADLIRRAPGLGARAAARLARWRAEIERGFVYDARPAAADRQRLGAIRAESVRREGALRRALLDGPARLEDARRAIEARRAAIEPELVALRRRRALVNADLLAALGRARRYRGVHGPSGATHRRSPAP